MVSYIHVAAEIYTAASCSAPLVRTLVRTVYIYHIDFVYSSNNLYVIILYEYHSSMYVSCLPTANGRHDL